MRFLLLLWLWAGVSAQQQIPQSAPVSPNAGTEAQANQTKARSVLDKMVEALGGPAYLNLQDSYTEGRYGRFHNEVMVGGTVYFRYWQWPDKERIELTKQRDEYLKAHGAGGSGFDGAVKTTLEKELK